MEFCLSSMVLPRCHHPLSARFDKVLAGGAAPKVQETKGAALSSKKVLMKL